ncbi:hypothetical protein ElyMa_000506800 [Elysia marginata]|uniref:Uncharacterized protein n=1 Tax=Elysia marginata TaxID=1093978 RepID=A0AAV4FWU1_9GAST|nr:hypothetical protein ElyMa_000506800 [Elysia marginata]
MLSAKSRATYERRFEASAEAWNDRGIAREMNKLYPYLILGCCGPETSNGSNPNGTSPAKTLEISSCSPPNSNMRQLCEEYVHQQIDLPRFLRSMGHLVHRLKFRVVIILSWHF